MSIITECTSVTSLIVEFRQNYPQLNGRIERAAAIVEQGQVTKQGENSYQVAGSRPQPYTVTWSPMMVDGVLSVNPGWSCTCPDVGSSGFAPVIPFNGGVQRTCKHITAVCITISLGSNYQPEPLIQAQPLDKVDVAQATARVAQERASGHYNANLSDKERAAKLSQAQRQQEAARRRLARTNGGPAPRGTHTGFYTASAEEIEQISIHDPHQAKRLTVGEQRQVVRASMGGALRADRVNLKANHNRNMNIRRR